MRDRERGREIEIYRHGSWISDMLREMKVKLVSVYVHRRREMFFYEAIYLEFINNLVFYFHEFSPRVMRLLQSKLKTSFLINILVCCT